MPHFILLSVFHPHALSTCEEYGSFLFYAAFKQVEVLQHHSGYDLLYGSLARIIPFIRHCHDFVIFCKGENIDTVRIVIQSNVPENTED